VAEAARPLTPDVADVADGSVPVADGSVPVADGAVPVADGAVPVADAAFCGAAYAGATGHHRAHDADVLSPVVWRPGMRVLDVGCGVGDLTARVADLVAPGEVLGVDASASQVAHAAAHARTTAGPPGPGAGLRFAVARAQELDRLVPAGWADVVLSVAVLHWVPEVDQPVVMAQVARALAPDGVFRADMGGAGQIEDTRAVLEEVAAEHGVGGSSWFFPDEATAGRLLDQGGLAPVRVQLRRQLRGMRDQEALERWLRSQVLPGYGRGGDPVRDSPARAAFEADAVARCVRLLRRQDGSYDQHYVRLDAVAVLA